MSNVLALARPEIRNLAAYRAAQYEDGLTRLNANETPWPPPGQAPGCALNRYPEERPQRLAAAMAAYYGVDAQRIVPTRGSSEGIDIMVRAFCRPDRDEIVICPPTFGMYEVYARLQPAAVRSVPLLRDQGYALDTGAILGGWRDTTRLVFICSPNNPTGNRVPTDEIRRLARELAGRGIVVVDGAYAEFATEDPTRALLDEFDNVVVLRTLSKALGLAGVRCGALLADPAVAGVAARVLPPYSFPTPSAEAAIACLEAAHRGELTGRIATLNAERERLATALAGAPGITRVWPSEANFVLVDSPDPAGLARRARAGGVLVRDFSWDPALPGCVRITVGSEADNDQLLEALR